MLKHTYLMITGLEELAPGYMCLVIFIRLDFIVDPNRPPFLVLNCCYFP
jgi:hypothetical protein